MKRLILFFFLSVGLTLTFSGCGEKTNKTQAANLSTAEKLSLELENQARKFFATKEKQAKELEKRDRSQGTNFGSTVFVQKGLPPDVWDFFRAGKKGDWKRTAKLYYQIAARSYQFDSRQPRDERLATTAWQPINEAFRGYEQLSAAEPKYILAYGREIVRSIPRDSVYFGGTDAGRFVITFLNQSEHPDEPFCTITQNALTDGLYLEYLRATYGKKISIPTEEDQQTGFNDYLQDAQQRLKDNKLKPGEDVKIVNGRVQVSGQIAVMQINARIAKILFDKNPEREFFLDDAGWATLDWMLPHMSPQGFIFKINRAPLSELSEEVVQKDRQFWKRCVSEALGDWLTDETSVQEVCDFGEKVFLKKDLADFRGDPRFVRTARNWKSLSEFVGASPVFSKSRSNIASLYAWWAHNSHSPEEKQRMTKEADFAFRQALALCPYQYGAIRDYYYFLAEQNRFEEATRVIQTTVSFFPDNKEYQDFLAKIKEQPKTK